MTLGLYAKVIASEIDHGAALDRIVGTSKGAWLLQVRLDSGQACGPDRSASPRIEEVSK
jgi:hypothetical protein